MTCKICFEEEKSYFDINDNEFYMEVNAYEIEDTYIKLTLCDKECLVGYYYFKDISEVSDIKYGTLVYIKGILEKPSNNTVPNNFNYKYYLNNRNIFYIIKISEIQLLGERFNIINKIRNYVTDRINKIDKLGYMKAFIMGIKDDINDVEYSKYQFIGVTHLFALSGMHISIIVMILDKIFFIFNKNIKYLIIDFILIFYGLVLYFPASLKRTILFYIINSFNKIFNIEINNIKVLLLTVFVLIFYDYKIIYQTGFIYSAVTVMGILLSNEFIKSSNKIISSFKLSVVAFLFSMPITMYIFYEVNILSIFYNMVYIFFVSVLIYPLCLISFIIPKLMFLFDFFIKILILFTDLLSNIKFLILNFNFNFLQILLWYLFLILFIKYKKKVVLVFLFLICFLDFLFPYLDNNVYFYFFDVGQGDSTLIVTPRRKDVILIDTGGLYGKDVSRNIIIFLNSAGIGEIDYLLLSHGDYDHMGEAINLVENFKVEKVIFNCGEFNELEQELIKVLDKKEIPYYSSIKELNVDDNKLYFLNNKDYGNENDNSSVIYTELNNHKFLFMGDAGVEIEKDLIEKYNLKDIDILKVGHHGSKTSSSKEFIDKIKPKYSIISVGKNNRYGHPNKEILDNLNTSKIYRTDEDGSIMFKIKNNKLKIETCSP